MKDEEEGKESGAAREGGASGSGEGMEEFEEPFERPIPSGPKAKPRFKMAGPLGQSPAVKTIAKAAAAVGLDIKQLGDLVIDSGILATPPDGFTEVLSLAELGTHMTSRMGQLPSKARPEWFRELSLVQRAAVVVSLRTNGCSTQALAQEFEVPAIEIQQVYNDHIDKIGQNTTNVRLTMIVGQMTTIAERAQHGSMAKNDWGTYWRIQKDLLAALQSLGIVDKAIHRVEVTHNLTDRTKENIERLASLRMKQATRRKEIAVVSTETTDAVPEEFVDEDE